MESTVPIPVVSLVYSTESRYPQIIIYIESFESTEFLFSVLYTNASEEVGGWIILRRILERYDGMVWTGLAWLRIGTSRELL
jgi:hypothetical protein